MFVRLMPFGHSASHALYLYTLQTLLLHLSEPILQRALSVPVCLAEEVRAAILSHSRQHRRRVLTGRKACPTADTASGINASSAIFLGIGISLASGMPTRVNAYIASSLLYTIERISVNNQIPEYGERLRPPGLNRYRLPIGE